MDGVDKTEQTKVKRKAKRKILRNSSFYICVELTGMLRATLSTSNKLSQSQEAAVSNISCAELQEESQQQSEE